MDPARIAQLSRTLASLIELVPEVEQDAIAPQELQLIIEAKYFRPEQDERITEWFAKFLTIRGNLWDIIDTAHEEVTVGLKNLSTYEEYQMFVIGYVTACHVVRLDRFLLEQFATHTFIQRKLNEGIPHLNVARKQYTHIFESFIDIDNAQRMLMVMNFAAKERSKIKRLAQDKDVGQFVDNIWRYRGYLDPSKQQYLKRAHHFLRHAVKRRGATIRQHTQFKILEASGRVFSEINNPKLNRVDERIRAQAREILLPGDVLVTRHRMALTNFLLPGYWPHAALFVGSDKEREAYKIELDARVQKRWNGNKCTFEALKDGVLFRPLENTLAVDGFVILRPTISQNGIKQAIERIVVHEGKQYNFDFDFFRSDRLVCTELMYRAFDGIEHMDIELRERAGRPTLSAEDLCDLALETAMFQPVAIFGVKGANGFETDASNVPELLRESYRK
ncbi:MAG: hypothetical protein HKN88_03320 [Gammaproteobacteria bacterium]|nr:hypothetical protein [Gammaproteobacteria bacterium]NNC97083.1 hypothetical protein [Gammaproteobacteria bacterium]NNM14070.1 hypothetical protein [Gammaproteobacteria bacterium]